MDTTILFTLLNPITSLIFAGAFFGLSRSEPGRPYLALFAISYLSTTAGFLFQALDQVGGGSWTKLVSNAFFFASAVGLLIAVAWRYKRPVPYLPVMFVAAAGYGVIVWFLFVSPDITVRIYALSWTVAILFAIGAWIIIKSRPTQTADWVVAGTLVLQATLFIGRTFVTIRFGTVSPTTGLHQSTYWIILTFTHMITTLVLVFALLTGIVMEAMDGLRKATVTDPLSLLLNRRGFEASAETALLAAARANRPACLVIADLDHFKSINDMYGHKTGDEVIVAFANTLNEVLRGAHVAGRIGGEEFSILVCGGDVRMAELISQGVRTGFAGHTLPPVQAAQPLLLSASFGIAQWLPGETYQDLLARADAALYDAKRAGRDCVRIANQDQTVLLNRKYRGLTSNHRAS